MPQTHKFAYPPDWTPEAERFLSDGEDDTAQKFEKPKHPDTLFVLNLPKVSKGGEDDKYAKLKKAIKKKLGKDESDAGFEVEMKVNEATGETYGMAVLKFPSKTAMEKGKLRIDGFKFGANILRALPADELDMVMELSDTFQYNEAAAPPLAYTDDVNDWQLDAGGREQLLIRYQQETEIHWVDSQKGVAEPYYCGEREKSKGRVWCDWKVVWSPHGSYLVTIHKPGLALWGGPEMMQKRKLMHKEVRELMFSPSEEYLLTWNGSPKEDNDKQAYRIWNVRTGTILKEIGTPSYNPSGIPGAFPHLTFSQDSQFFARCTEKEIHIHSLPTCAPFKRPGTNEPLHFRFENGITSFQWSPKDPIIAVWSPQVNDSPSCLTVVNAAKGETLNNKSRLNFNATMHWQSQGDFLCVVLAKRGKKDAGPNKAKNLDILRMREKNIPVETLEVEEGIKGFFWEPRSNRFALLTEAGTGKTLLTFYSLANSKCEQISSFELQAQTYNQVFWSPDGQYFVVAAIGSGELLWGRLHPDKMENAMELLYKDDQVNLTNVEWDARGRYVMTSVVAAIDGSRDFAVGQDAGFTLWTFQGRPIHQEQCEKLYAVHFRPNPPSLLSESEENEVRKNLKAHSRRFDQIDDEAKTRQRREEKERKEKSISEFKSICAVLNTNYMHHATAIKWEDAQQGFKMRHAWQDKKETVEELLETKEEVIENL